LFPPRADAAFIVALLSPLRRRSIHQRATAPFIVARCAASSAFVVTSLFPSLLRCRFCLRHCAAAAFVIALPLASSSRRRSLRYTTVLTLQLLYTTETPSTNRLTEELLTEELLTEELLTDRQIDTGRQFNLFSV